MIRRSTHAARQRCLEIPSEHAEQSPDDRNLPPYYKIGGRVVYRLPEIKAWLDTKRRRSTSDAGTL